MKAITYTRYGLPDVLGLEEVEKPSLRTNEVLVKICAASVNAGRARTGIAWLRPTGSNTIVCKAVRSRNHHITHHMW
jgi:hypothetical protein